VKVDLVKIVSEMVKTKQEIYDISEKLKYHEGNLDKLIAELVEFLKHRRFLEPRKVSSKKPAAQGQ
jgi:hypothetical protein